ncbi:hypothetical protein EVAR_100666_1 [Eumeta japonica]|uniref:Uncharacterized protein n=1 Tax=Eumeta variegata TaxID=151549 RepID=A0A4C1SDP9_EUMVA|nr:hypothetical protein EVAR_100666_1 [Eumeta japonica]
MTCKKHEESRDWIYRCLEALLRIGPYDLMSEGSWEVAGGGQVLGGVVFQLKTNSVSSNPEIEALAPRFGDFVKPPVADIVTASVASRVTRHPDNAGHS